MQRTNFDELVKSQIAPVIVIPVKTGIQGLCRYPSLRSLVNPALREVSGTEVI